MTSRTLSREEEAELARSNKKVKDFSHAEFNGGSRASSPTLENQARGPNTKPSFKDKLVGEIPGAFAQAFDLTDQMEEDIDSDDECGEASTPVREGQVRIMLSKETKKRIRGPWSKALIVKLIGKTMGLNYMQSRLAQLWRPEGRMDCIDLTYGFFLVRFYSKDDLERVIKKGPWFIGDHFLSLRPWEPFFKPATANVSLVAAWIRLNALPIELYETEVLKEIGDSIGKVLRIDSHTALEARGRYARLCIQIDINKPLVNSILIGRFEQVVTYEGIHKLCFSCGRVGHKIEACPYTIRKDEEKEPEAPRKETADEGSADLQNLQDAVTHNACESTNVEGHYGPWMLVTRRGNGQKGKRTENGSGRGSGFSGSSAWMSSSQLPPVFAEGTCMAVGDLSARENLPQRLANPKFGAGSKKGTKVWASKSTDFLNLKDRPISNSSPNSAKLSVDNFKAAVACLKQDNSPCQAPRAPTAHPNSVKSKKHLARKLATVTLPFTAASPCVETSEKKSTNPPLSQPSASCSVSNFSAGNTFEFSATTNVEIGAFVGTEDERNLQIQDIGEKSHADERMESDEGIQISPQSSDSEVGSLVEVHMVSNGGGLDEDHMVSDEGNGAAPFL